jgi:hypothetical protein
VNSYVVTGEGVTDMGSCRNQQAICSGTDFEIGAVAQLLFKLIYQHLPEWNADQLDQAHPTNHLTFVSGAWLGQSSKGRRRIRPSKDVKKEFLEHAQRAEALAQYAIAHQHEIAAYFHDTDGTRSDKQDRRECLRQAIMAGFRAAEFGDKGLAMIPKPTSEAWFICGVKATPYQHCTQLEDELSGNDRSPERAPKVRLGEHLGNPNYTRQDLNALVEQLDVTRIDMPSFNELREQVKTAITNAVCNFSLPLQASTQSQT